MSAKQHARSLREEREALHARAQDGRIKLEAARARCEMAAGEVRGRDRAVAQAEADHAAEQRKHVLAEVQDVSRKLRTMRETVVGEACLVGATLATSYLSTQLRSGFDVVIVDEASMALLPALFHAAGLAREKVVVSGDFRQLAPIVESKEKAVLDVLGGDAFAKAGISGALANGRTPPRTVMLDTQYRMAEPICRLIVDFMYHGRLRTGTIKESVEVPPPSPFEGALTLVDTSGLDPSELRDAGGSPCNPAHASVCRDIVHHLHGKGWIAGDPRKAGICTPYASHARLLLRVLESDARGAGVDAGTVHRYQGDEKELLVLDLPDGKPNRAAGRFLRASAADEEGARLLNVAISRARRHLVVVADLAWLDRHLPPRAWLRDILRKLRQEGRVVDGRDLLDRGTNLDLHHELGRSETGSKAGRLLSGEEFQAAFLADLRCATKSILIFSGFVTPRQVDRLADTLRDRVSAGVEVRCVTRPPWDDGSTRVRYGKAALDGLEAMGCVVDTREGTHQKVAIIDGSIVWWGSLNPLSFGGQTGEVMTRQRDQRLAVAFGVFLAIDRRTAEAAPFEKLLKAENLRCPKCRARTAYCRHGRSAFFRCEACSWSGASSHAPPGRAGPGGHLADISRIRESSRRRPRGPVP